MNQPKQSVRSYWRDNRSRRAFRGMSPFRGRNVISATRWKYVRAHQRLDMIDGRLKLLDARISAANSEIAALVEDIVRRELAAAGIVSRKPSAKP